jgi:hypothetical protein
MLLIFFAGQVIEVLRLYNSKSEVMDPVHKVVLLAVRDAFNQPHNGKIKLSVIEERVNSGLPRKVKFEARKISSILKKFGFQTGQVGGYSHVFWNQELILKLCKQYLDTSTSSPTS